MGTKDNEDKETGVIWAPYIPINVSTSINGETVWYRNKWKNFWLQVKFFFKKPRYLKNESRYKLKPINTKYYNTIKIKKDE